MINNSLNVVCQFGSTVNLLLGNNWTYITCSITKKDITISQFQNSDNGYSTANVAITYTNKNLFITGGTDDNCLVNKLDFNFLLWDAADATQNLLVREIQINNSYKDQARGFICILNSN